MVLESTQLDRPIGLELIEEGLDWHQGLRPQAEEANSGVLRHPFVLDHSGFQEDAEVLAHRRLRSARGPGQVAGSVITRTQKLDEGSTGRVGQNLKSIHCGNYLL
jgi:hypothetical protein